MNNNELIKTIEKCEIDINKVKFISEKFCFTPNEFISKFISYVDKSDFIAKERRILGYSEVLNCDEDISDDLVNQKCIPFIDCYDGEFIVYVIDEDKWGLYSVYDNLIYDERNNLEDLL